MNLTAEEFDLILRRASQRARKRRPPWLDTQDLTQAAELAMIEAERGGRMQEPIDKQHLEAQTNMRVFGAMIDAIRDSYRHHGGTRRGDAVPPPQSYDQTDFSHLVDQHVAPDNPVRTLELKQAVERLRKRGSARALECVALLANGLSVREVAEVMSISESRVIQLRTEARQLMDL
jgi:hypothetical protein